MLLKNVKEKLLKAQEESLQQYNHGNLTSIENRKKHLIKSKYYKEIYDKFVEYCLVPEGYLKNNGKVFA